MMPAFDPAHTGKEVGEAHWRERQVPVDDFEALGLAQSTLEV